jgi:HAD superfamily hydrolase (TIGR01509 family)
MTETGAFIFDMDGTIVDNMRVHERVWIEFLSALGIRVTAETFHREASGKTTEQILMQWIGDHLTDFEIASYSERKEARYRDLYRPELEAVEGLSAFLDESRRLGVPLALATSGGKPNIDFVLGGLGIAECFAVVVGAEEVTHGKPHPEIYTVTARKLGVEARRCLVFEDSLVGIQAVSRAGMKAVALATTVDPREFRHNPTVIRIARNFTDLRPGELLEETIES